MAIVAVAVSSGALVAVTEAELVTRPQSDVVVAATMCTLVEMPIASVVGL